MGFQFLRQNLSKENKYFVIFSLPVMKVLHGVEEVSDQPRPTPYGLLTLCTEAKVLFKTYSTKTTSRLTVTLFLQELVILGFNFFGFENFPDKLH
jgi:hypothetical protein